MDSLTMLIPGFWRYCKGFELTPQQEKAIDWLLWAILIQFGLGVLTLIMVVPVWLGCLASGRSGSAIDDCGV